MTWFKTNSYSIVKMILNQFGVAIMSLMLITITQTRKELMLVAALYATVFYLILLYMMTWELGAKDRIRADAKIVPFDALQGVKLSLAANLPNFLIALLMGIGYLFGVFFLEEGWAQGMFGIAHTVGVVWEAMFTGLINSVIDPAAVSSLSPLYILAYFLIPLPAIGASALGYAMGSHDRRIFGSLFASKRK